MGHAGERSGGIVPRLHQPGQGWSAKWGGGAAPPIPRAGQGLQLTQPGCTLHVEEWKQTCPQQDGSPVFPGVFPRVLVGVAKVLFPAEQDKCLELGQEGPVLGIP